VISRKEGTIRVAFAAVIVLSALVSCVSPDGNLTLPNEPQLDIYVEQAFNESNPYRLNTPYSGYVDPLSFFGVSDSVFAEDPTTVTYEMWQQYVQSGYMTTAEASVVAGDEADVSYLISCATATGICETIYQRCVGFCRAIPLARERAACYAACMTVYAGCLAGDYIGVY
jgi:hypothetical protein